MAHQFSSAFSTAFEYDSEICSGFECTILNRLFNDTTLQGLLSRIYPAMPTDNCLLPMAWYTFKRSDRLVFGNVATGISEYVFDLNIFAKSQGAVKEIADRVITLLSGFKSPPDVGMCVLKEEAQQGRPGDGYIYYVKSQRYTGLGLGE